MPAAENASHAGNEIVVTARKREERLIDIPQSVTAVTAEDLARLDATQFRDFANTVPALSYTSEGAGKTQVSLRGVTAGIDIGPTVGIYVDDVPYGSSSAFSNASGLALDVGLFDLDRVEVLRGPQGTLYGASTMGGLIKYVTARPDLTRMEGTAQAGLSTTNEGGTGYNLAGAISLPVAQGQAALRTSGFYTHDGGFIDDPTAGREDIDRSDIYGGRLDLLIQPAESLSLRLTGFLQNIDRDGNPAADFDLSGAPVDGSLDQRRLFTEPFRNRFRLVSGTIDYDFGPASLTSITSYQSTKTRFRQDASAVYVPALAGFGLVLGSVAIDQGRSTDKFTQEVRLASTGERRLEWLLGGFYTHERSGNTQQTTQLDPAGQPFPLNLATLSIPSTYEEYAGFGNLTFRLTDRFDISGGLRYAANRQRFEQIGSGLLVGSVPETRTTDEVATYLLNARYKFSDDATAYLRYATGYRPGGPNFVVNDPATGLPLAEDTFRSDSLESYEAGFRAQTADRAFAIDLAAYHIDWKDIQVTTVAGGVSVIANAGRAAVDGGELTLTVRPMTGFTASGAFAYQDARLTEDAPLLGARDGDRLPNVPRFTAALNLDYRLSEEGLQPRLGATLRHVSARKAAFDGNAQLPQYRLPAYTSVDLRAGASLGKVDLQLFVRNLFDERGQISAFTVLSSLGGPAQVTMLQPRTIGLSATTRF
ncbi:MULTISPECIES: TonB-dependent receptor [Sphingomonas]|uniref:TonB-dependent receptor n=1 Tax=Sphingomonas TaxID=13687 RepID=UPI0015EC5662|nr:MULTISPECIES: TonB-dependent receptor [Sphingomonas]MBA2921006.1 TonB-dependent receptor [Sphingomonas sp. CGMCC 1.13658]